MSTQDQDPRLWLGARIRSLRAEKDWTQAELAERLGMSHQTVARSEAGLRTVGIEELVALARAFGITVAELVAPMDVAVMTDLTAGIVTQTGKLRSAGDDTELVTAAAKVVEGYIDDFAAQAFSISRVATQLAAEVTRANDAADEMAGILKNVAETVVRLKESQDGVDKEA